MTLTARPLTGPTGLAIFAMLTAAVLLASAGGVMAQQAGAKLQFAPMPPPRPASLGARPPAGAELPRQEAAATVPAQSATVTPASREPLSEKAGVELLNSYFNSFPVLTADFIQVGADGRRYEGKLYIQRPGKMRFEYKPPATIEIIADGNSVAIRDRKLATQDLYSIGQTPLKFLLKEKIDLTRDTSVKSVTSARDTLTVQIEDKTTLGGTSKISLQYDRVANVLRQWSIIDPQGYETTVTIFNVDTQRRHNPAIFAINYERVLDDKK
jgi:outer membrane lipoprotein-sorting protein